MHHAHDFQRVLPIMGCLAALASTVDRANNPKPLVFLAFQPGYRDNDRFIVSGSGQIATGETL
jgi:hypothetical protein